MSPATNSTGTTGVRLERLTTKPRRARSAVAPVYTNIDGTITHGRRAGIVPSMFVYTGATALLALLGFVVSRSSLTPVVPVLFVAGLMAGGAHGLLYPGLAALVTDTAAETRRGVIVAMFSAVFLVGQTAGSFAFGYITHAIDPAVWPTRKTAL